MFNIYNLTDLWGVLLDLRVCVCICACALGNLGTRGPRDWGWEGDRSGKMLQDRIL